MIAVIVDTGAKIGLATVIATVLALAAGAGWCKAAAESEQRQAEAERDLHEGWGRWARCLP